MHACRRFVRRFVVLALGTVAGAAWGQEQASIASTPSPTFAGAKTLWHGFDRYDFLMDESDQSIKPHKAAPDEGNAVRTSVKGALRCVVVAPKAAAPGNPWSWQGYYFDHEPQTEVELLKRGFHIGFIWCDAGKPWDAWYAFLTVQHGFSKKPAFVGMSRGGRNAYTWATANPDKVSCIYADNPAISRDALGMLGALAKADVPLLHVCGSIDPILGNHTLVAESVYQQLGGRISVMIKDGVAHHPHSLRDPQPIADFIESSQGESATKPPAFVGQTFTKSSYYGIENDYREFQSEKTFVACRGPWFTPAYDRYEFRLDGIRMPVTVIVPKRAAEGNPWVFRADFVTRDSVVDLALLDQGFHIVTGPVPTDTDGPVLEQWNTVYKHLTDAGLSQTPVLAGAGGAAGEAYAWAVENPNKVCCVYGENPILRSHMTKAQPLDRLDVLAKAGVPLLHVCGSRDPWLDSQTRFAERRYQELGGQMTVIVEEAKAHYPTAPRNPRPIVDIIVTRSTTANNRSRTLAQEKRPGANAPQLLARSPQQVAEQLAAVYGKRLEQVAYIPALPLVAKVRLSELLHDPKYANEVDQIVAPFLIGEKSPVPKSGSEQAGHLVFAELALRAKGKDRERWIQLCRNAADQIFDKDGQPLPIMPFHSEMSDAVFMAGPILAATGKLTGERKYFDAAVAHFSSMRKLCVRPDGLYRHSPLCEAAWGRGNGFPALGIALALSDWSDDHPARQELIREFQKHMAALNPHQDANTGCWHQVVDHPESYDEYSCTCMIGFAMQRGIRRGWLDKSEYQRCVDRAWRAIEERTSIDGQLVNVCTGTGKQKALQDYFDRPAINGRDDRGGAMGLLFATELIAFK